MSSKSVRELRARAHSLKPVVWISQKGMSEGALRETDRALTAHELIKVHAALDDRVARQALLTEICTVLNAAPVQVLGKVLVVFRANAKPADAPTPRSREKPAQKPNHGAAGTKRSRPAAAASRPTNRRPSRAKNR